MNKNEILKLTNQQREKNHLTPLSGNKLLEIAADRKTSEMISKNYFDHFNPDQKTIANLTPKEYKYFTLGENLAFGYKNPKELVNAWMESESHRDNILYTRYREHAVSVAPIKNDYLVAYVFGTQQQDYLKEVKGIREYAIQKSESFLENIFWISATLFLMVGAVLLFQKVLQRK